MTLSDIMQIGYLVWRPIINGNLSQVDFDLNAYNNLKNVAYIKPFDLTQNFHECTLVGRKARNKQCLTAFLVDEWGAPSSEVKDNWIGGLVVDCIRKKYGIINAVKICLFEGDLIEYHAWRVKCSKAVDDLEAYRNSGLLLPDCARRLIKPTFDESGFVAEKI